MQIGVVEAEGRIDQILPIYSMTSTHFLLIIYNYSHLCYDRFQTFVQIILYIEFFHNYLILSFCFTKSFFVFDQTGQTPLISLAKVLTQLPHLISVPAEKD